MLVSVLLNFIAKVLTTERTTFSSDRLRDPHEFQTEFTKLVRALKERRLVIVFDNLDRVAHDRAVETLSTIKTFLEPVDRDIQNREIVFLIPCDDQAIRAHISGVYAINKSSHGVNEIFDPEEFLRKFFNTIIWIPQFIASELEAFARDCLASTKVADLNDPSIAWLITRAYRENPRQIIQFVNILVSNYVLILGREGDERDFEPGFASSHRKEICLYFLLVHLYSLIMTKLREQKYISLEHIPESVEGIDEDELEAFKKFLQEVSTEVRLSNLRPYYSLRRSEQEKQFPGIEQLYTYMEDNQIDEAQKLAESIEGIKEKVDAFSLAVANELDNKTNPTSAAYFTGSLLHIVRHLGIVLSRSCCARIVNAIKTRLPGTIDVIPPSLLYEKLLSEYSEFVKEVCDVWVKRIAAISKDENLRKTKTPFIHELYSVAAKDTTIASYVGPKTKQILAEHYVPDTELVRVLIAEADTQQQFFSREFVSQYIESLSDKDLAVTAVEKEGDPGAQNRLALLNRMHSSFFDLPTLKAGCSKLEQLVQALAAKSWKPEFKTQWERVFQTIREFIVRHEMKSITGGKETAALAEALLTSVNTIPDWDSRSITIPLLMVLDTVLTDPHRSQVADIKNQFFNSASPKAIEYCLGFIDDQDEFILSSPFATILHTRSMKDPALFDSLYERLPNEARGTWLLSLLNANTSHALAKIKDLGFKFPSDEMKIVSKVLQLAKAVPPQQKPQHYEVAIRTDCAGDSQLQAEFVAQLKELLTSGDANAQKVAYDVLRDTRFLTEQQARDIAKKVLDWLLAMGEGQRYQHHAIEVVFMYLGHLTKEERGQLVQLCFDDLIIKSGNINAINLGFQILIREAVSYDENRHFNFDDVRRFIEDGKAREVCRHAIVNGLKELRELQKEGSKDNEYWRWVKSLEPGPG